MHISDKFITLENQKYVEELLNQVIKTGLDFKINSPSIPNKFSEKEWIEIEKYGIKNGELNKLFEEKVLPFCSNFSNIGFLGFPDAGNSISGMLGAFWADLLQQNLINESFCAPVATRIEMEVLSTLRKTIGYTIKDNIESIMDVGGIITYGGTVSNTIAMMLARENRGYNSLNEGVIKPKKYKVIVPKNIGHYSIQSSLKWIGCGNQIIEVETNAYRYNLKSFEKTLIKERGNIMAVVVYAGDSRTMTIEHLDKIIEIVKRIDPTIWCHVDGCHGFSLSFSQKYNSKLKGIDKYDSISCDPHKVLALPYCCSALLLKDGNNFSLISSNSDLIMNEKFAFGQITPFIGSKSWVSLKLWFVMKNLGIIGIGKMIDRRIEIANYFANKMREYKEFVILNEVDYNSVVFVYVSNLKNTEEINKVNKKIYEYIKKEGKYYLHQFPLVDDIGYICKGQKYNVLRYMSGNYNLYEEDIDKFIFYLKNIAKECKNELFS